MEEQLQLVRQEVADFGFKVIPFVLPRKDHTWAQMGLAAASWVIDLLEWTYSNAAERQYHCIMGLLLGYSVQAMAEHDGFFYTNGPEPMVLSTSN